MRSEVMKTLPAIIAIVSSFVYASVAAPQEEARKIFDVKFEAWPDNVEGGLRRCMVYFSGDLPSPGSVDKILRLSLESAIISDSSHNIVARACLDDDAGTNLKSTQYSGAVYYRSSDKRIMGSDEFFGVKKIVRNMGNYSVVTEDGKDLTAKKRIFITLFFQKSPLIDEAYTAVIAEAVKAAPANRHLDIEVRIGDPDYKTKHTPALIVKDPKDGIEISVKYDPATKTIVSRGKIIKKLF